MSEEANKPNAQSEKGQAQDASAASPRPKKKRRWGVWFLLLLVLAAAGAVLWAKRTGTLASWIARMQKASPSQTQAPASAAPQQQPRELPQNAQTRLIALVQAMDELSARLDALEQLLRTRQTALAAERRSLLLLGLARAAAPHASLAEIASGWRLAAVAETDPKAREEAKAHADEAERALAEAMKARHALLAAAETLASRWRAENVIPTPDNPWLARLVGWIHLYRAPPKEAARRAQLAVHLRALADDLLFGRAPSDASWEPLRAEVLLALRAQGKRLALPRSLAAIARVKQALVRAAQTRLQEISS